MLTKEKMVLDTLYPEWKKKLWRIARVFVAAAIVQSGLLLVDFKAENLANLTAFGAWLLVFIKSALISGVVAIGVEIRGLFGSPDKTSLVDKIPI